MEISNNIKEAKKERYIHPLSDLVSQLFKHVSDFSNT
jgi:hypothetical protein